MHAHFRLPLLGLLGAVAPAAAQGHVHHPGDYPIPTENVCGVYHAVSGAPCPAGVVTVPAGWFSGDTHEHIQLCFSGDDLTPGQIYAGMLEKPLDVCNALIWGAGFIDPWEFAQYTEQFVSGLESPATASDPAKILQFGIETSGVSCANLGHMIGLNITPAQTDLFQYGLGCGPIFPAAGWKNDGSGDYSKPILDLFRQASGAVTGYAHQSWPVNLYEDRFAGGFDWEDPTLPAYVGADAKCSFGMDMAFPLPKTCGNTQPVLAPFDVALGRLDFLEAFELLNPTCGGLIERRYFGMYYKLLNAGQHVALSAGTDADCVGLACEPRVYALLEPGDAFTYANWTKALAKGRTSLASGPYQFLELKVDGHSVGEQIELPTENTVNVKVTYTVEITEDAPVEDSIEIVQNGVVVASQPFFPMTSGSVTFNKDVLVSRSGWIAARTASYGTHTGAVRTLVDGAPIAIREDAEYWTLYADFLNWNLDAAQWAGPAALEYYVGCSEAEIRDYVAQGRRIFAAVRDYDVAPPQGIVRHGQASPASCSPPAALVTADVPYAGQPFALRAFNAPPSTFGGLVLALQLGPSTPLLGAVLHVPLNPALLPIPWTTDEGGYTELFVPQMPNMPGAKLFVQGVWLNPAGCTESGLLSSSDALEITLQ
jgi:hypothetical protein